MSIISNFARSVTVELIAKQVVSYEAYDGGTLMRSIAAHNIRDFFRKYGSTARKFDHIADGDIYVGYVRMSGRPEFLSAIVLAGDDAIAVSFDSAVDESNDFLTLMAKAEFAEKMGLAVQRGAERMRNASSPPAPPAQTIAVTSPQSTPGRKKNYDVWFALICVGGLLGAVFVIPVLQDLDRPTAPTPLFSAQQSYDAGMVATAPPDIVDIEAPTTPSPNEVHGVTGSAVMTYGMLDSVMGGADKLLAVHREDGMIGAETASAACLKKAETSAQISDLDECAAFDFSAQFLDDVANNQLGFPPNRYFADADARLNAAYARFPEHSVERLALIKHQTTKVLVDTATGASN